MHQAKTTGLWANRAVAGVVALTALPVEVDQRAILTDQLQLYATRARLVRVQSEALAQRLHLALGGGIAADAAAAGAAPQASASGSSARNRTETQTTGFAVAPKARATAERE